MGFATPALQTATNSVVSSIYATAFAALLQDAFRSAVSIQNPGGTTFTKGTGGWTIADGKRLQLTGAIPNELSGFTTVWVRRLSPTTFGLCTSFANYQASTLVSISSAIAAGACLGYDRDIDDTDTIESLVSYEVSFLGYQRQLRQIPNSTAADGASPKVTTSINVTFTSTDTRSARVSHLLSLFGGGTIPGSIGYVAGFSVDFVNGNQSVSARSNISITYSVTATSASVVL